MSKSLGNFTNLLDLVDDHDPRAYRLLVLRSHYRAPIEVSKETIADAEAVLERLDSLRREVRRRADAVEPDAAALDRFRAVMDDDLGTPGGDGAARRPRPPGRTPTGRRRPAGRRRLRSPAPSASSCGPRRNRRAEAASSLARAPRRGPGREGLGAPPMRSATSSWRWATRSTTAPTARAAACRGPLLPMVTGGNLTSAGTVAPDRTMVADMTDFSLSLNEDQLQIKKWVHDFAETSSAPPPRSGTSGRSSRGRSSRRPPRSASTASTSWPSASIGDPTGLTLPVAIEELFWGDAGIGLSIFGSGLGRRRHRRQRHARAGHRVGAPVLRHRPTRSSSAPSACPSPTPAPTCRSLRTRAVYDEAKDEWVLNGTKAWITNGGIADVHVVVATVDPELKGRGQASFVVPPGTKGLSQGQKYKKHGIRASHTAEVVLDDVRVPGSLPPRRQGQARREAGPGPRSTRSTGEKQPAMATFEATRPAVGAMAIGIARAAYEYSLEYAKERKAFGKPIIENQAIAFMLADMITEIDAARLLVHRAAWLARNGEYKNAEGSQSKLKAGRTAVWVTERAIQILGGYGYTREYPVERWHRDAKIFDIFEGTEQIQQLVIARAISGLRIE